MFKESAYLKKIFDNSIVPVSVYDRTGKIIYFNSASVKLYDKPDILYKLFAPPSKEIMKKLFVHKKRSGEKVLILATCIYPAQEESSDYIIMSHVIGSNNYSGIREFMYYNIESNPLLLYSDGKVEAHNSIVMGYLDGLKLDGDVEYFGEIGGIDSPARKCSAGLEAKTLTKRESDILFLLYKASTVKDISENLSISENTVKTHLKKIYRKFSVQNRMQLINRVFINRD